MIIENRNEIRIRGRVVTISDAHNGQKRITLIVKNEHRDVFPEVICAPEIIPECKEHAMLDIEGYVMNDGLVRDGEKTYYPRLYATSINVASTLLYEEFHIEGRFWSQKPCMAFISGEIDHIVSDEVKPGMEYMRYFIKTSSPEGETLIRLDWKKIDRHPELHEGDFICAACKINTPRKEIGTNLKNFLNIDVFDMNKIE